MMVLQLIRIGCLITLINYVWNSKMFGFNYGLFFITKREHFFRKFCALSGKISVDFYKGEPFFGKFLPAALILVD